MFLLVIVVVVYKNEQVIFAALLPADYCQRGLPFTSSGGRTESVWKHDIRLGCKALGLKAKDADQIDYCQLGKLAVGKASTQNKALADFQIRTATGQCGLQHLHRVLERICH